MEKCVIILTSIFKVNLTHSKRAAILSFLQIMLHLFYKDILNHWSCEIQWISMNYLSWNVATHCEMNIYVCWNEMWSWMTTKMLSSEYSTVNVPHGGSSEDEIKLDRIRHFLYSTLMYTVCYYSARRYHCFFW